MRYRKRKIGLLYKCWNCGHISNIWSIYCDTCGVDKMQYDNKYNVLDNKKKNNVYYVANGSA